MAPISTSVGPGQTVTSFAAWMATLPANVGTSGNTYICNVIGKLTDVNQSLAGHSCTATNYITITAPAGQSFADNQGRLAYNAAAWSAWESRNDHSPMLAILDNYTVLSRLQFYSTGQTQRCIFVNAMNCWVDRCIIESQQRNGLGVLLLYGPGNCNHVVSNTLCVARTSGANGIEVTSLSTAINCTVVRPADIGPGSSGQGINLNYGTNTIRNCAIFGFFDNAITPTPNADGHNVTDIANCPGTTGNITGAVYANQFENYTDYGADFRLKPGSDCINAGVTDATNLPSGADIFGISRPYGASWDVGANEWKKAPLIAKIGTGGAAAGRDYSSISAWIASLPANLVTDGNSYRGECYNDGEFPDGRMTIGGHTTDATHTITLTTAAGHSFRDHANKLTNRLSYNQAVGVGIKSDNGHATVFACLDNYTTISNLQVWTTGTTACVVQLNGTYSVAENMIIQGTVRDNRYAFCSMGDGNSTSVFRNVLVISMKDYTFGLGASIGFSSGSFANFVNCTAVKTLENTYAATGANGNGFQTGYQPSLVRNCMSFGFIGNYSQLTAPADGHNSTDVSFIHGTIGTKVNQVYADQFVNPSQLPPETMDFRLKNTSTSINAGADASSVTLQGSNVVTMTTDGLGTTRPVNATWDIGFEESFLTGTFVPPPPWFDTHVEAMYLPPLRRPYQIRRVVVPPPQVVPTPTTKTFYVLITAAVSPNWWSILKEGGSVPSAAASGWGWKVGNNSLATSPYWRSRLGSSTINSTVFGTTSYIAAPVAGPIVGTTVILSGDSFISPNPYTGNFASGNWVMAWGIRGVAAQSCAGLIRCRVWASVNANGSSPRELTTSVLVSTPIVTAVSSTTNTTTITWAAPAITLTNEYLFFQIEWNSTTTGSNSNPGVNLYQSATSITTTVFTPPASTVIGRLIRNQERDTLAAAGTVVAPTSSTGTLNLNQDLNTISATGTVTTPSTDLYLVSSFTPGGDRNDYTGGVGFVFTLAHGETYNKIGVRKGTGNTGTHTVGLYVWNADPVPLDFLRSATIDLTAGAVGSFYYADITPITLDTSHTYGLLHEVVNGDGQFWSDHGATSLTNYGGYVQYAACGPGGLGGHGTAGSNEQFAGVDLAYVSGAPPPGVTGTLNLNQDVNQISAFAGPIVGGAYNTPQAPGQISAFGAAFVTGTLNLNQGINQIATVAGPAVAGTLNIPQGANQISTLAGPVARGTLNLNQDINLISAIARSTPTGTLSKFQDPNLISTVATVAVSGTLNLPQDPNTLGSSGTVGGGLATVVGTLSKFQDPNTLSTNATVGAITGTLGRFQDINTINAAGTVSGGLATVTGTLNVPQAPDLASTVAGPIDTGTLNRNQAPDTLAGSAFDPSYIAHWKLSDGSGTDLTGHSNDGIFNGSMTPSTVGPIGNAATFAATGYGANDQVINIPYITFSVWVKTTGSGQIAGFAEGFANATTDKDLIIRPDGTLSWYIYTPSPTFLYTTATVNDGQWHHVAATYDGSTQSIYIDGTISATQSPPGASYSGYNGPNVFLGGYGHPNAGGVLGVWFVGALDDFRIYNRGITASEVAAIYAQGGLGPPIIRGTLNLNQGINQISTAAGPVVTGTLNRPQAPDLSSTVAGPIVTSTLNRPQDPNTISTVTGSTLTATLNRPQDPDLISTLAGPVAAGVLNKPQDPNTISATGAVAFLSDRTAALNVSQDPNGLVGFGSVVAAGARAGALYLSQAPDVGKVNFIRNPRMEGAVAGTPGTPPSYMMTLGWGTFGGITQTIVGTGVEDGIPYIEMRFFGTPTLTETLRRRLEMNNSIPTIDGTLCESLYVRRVGGSIANIHDQFLDIEQYDTSGQLRDRNTTNFGPPGSGVLASQRLSRTEVMSRDSSDFTLMSWGLTLMDISLALPVDITVRLGGPQLEFNNISPLMLPPVGSPQRSSQLGFVVVSSAAALNSMQMPDYLSSTGTVSGSVAANDAKLNVPQDPNAISALGGGIPGGALNLSQAPDKLFTVASVSGGLDAVVGRLSLAQDANTTDLQGVSVVRGTLNASQFGDTLGSSAVVLPVITGTLNRPQDANSISATGAIAGGLSPIISTLNQFQQPQITNIAYGVLTLTSTLNLLQAPDRLDSVVLISGGFGPVVGALDDHQPPNQISSFANTGTITGSLNRPQAPDTFSAQGVTVPSATLNLFQAPDRINAVGVAGTITGALNTFQAPDRISSSGIIGGGLSVVVGTVNKAQSPDTFFGHAVMTAGLAMDALQAPDRINAQGVLTFGLRGNILQDPQLIYALGEPIFSGGANIPQGANLFSGISKVLVSGALNLPQAPDKILSAANSGADRMGHLNALQAPDRINAVGRTGAVIGTLNYFQAPDRLFSTVGVAIRGGLTATQDPDIVQGSIDPVVRGSLNAPQARDNLQGAGGPVMNGRLNKAQDAQVTFANGQVGIDPTPEARVMVMA